MNKPMLFLLSLGATLAACGEASQPAVAYGDNGQGLALRWEWLRHDPRGGGLARFTFLNRGPETLSNNWALYYNQIAGGFDAEGLPPSVRLERLSGDWFRLRPTEAFPGLSPGDSAVVEYRTAGPVWKRSWAPEGPYLVFIDERGQESRPQPIGDYRVASFTRPEQLSAGPNDRRPLVTPEWRYRRDEGLEKLPEGLLPPILPTPVAYLPGDDGVFINADWRIHHAPGLGGEAEYLNQMLERLLGRSLLLAQSDEEGTNIIRLRLGPVMVDGALRPAGSQAYSLVLTRESGIVVNGADNAGAFYALQSLLSLVSPRAFAERQERLELPVAQVLDVPRYAYRGLHLDMARNFVDKESVLRIIDLMAYYKLNKLHLHLSDDEGWRLEIPELPELTQVGARRGHTLAESDMLHPSYGSGPFADLRASYGTGHYSRSDFIEILERAKRRHIEVIPEIDMPGHSRAAILAMKAREKRLRDEGRGEEALAYRLHDPEDSSRYRSIQDYDDNVICVCQESFYLFFETVLRNILGMYKDAQAPLSTVHIGGDEVPAGVWEGSPLCRRLIAQRSELSSSVDLNYYFVRRVSEILRRYGLKTSGWEEIALRRASAPGGGVRYEPHPEFRDRQHIPYVWDNTGDNVDLAHRLANAGYPLVLCSASHLYFDLAYDRDPEEPGLMWAGTVDTRQVFSFTPDDVFKSLSPGVDTRGRAAITPQGRGNIIGIQGQLWSEQIKGRQMLEYAAFPKALALAERAWAPLPSWAAIAERAERERALAEAWNLFANRLGQRELPRLDWLLDGVAYRLPPPGALVENGQLRVNTAYPGLVVRYTLDGTTPNVDSPVYEGPVALTGAAHLATFDTRGRMSRVARTP